MQDAARNLNVVMAQVFGSGGSSGVVVPSLDGMQSVGTAWSRYRWRFNYTDISGKTVGPGNYNKISIALPLNQAVTINVAIPQFERGHADTPWFLRLNEEYLLGRLLLPVSTPSSL